MVAMAESSFDAARTSAAARRNREPILQALLPELPQAGLVLEVASGTGEHIVHFATARPDLQWQPTDPSPEARASTASWVGESDTPHILPPIDLDVQAEVWPLVRADAVICINMLHIAPWEATVGLMRGAAALLSAGGLLFVYGPFLREGIVTADSNLAFDAELQRRDARWGLRQVEDVAACAEAQGLALQRVVEMPANNLSLVFRKVAGA